MPLKIGPLDDETTMSHEIYKEINKELSPPLQVAIDNAKSDDEKKSAEDILTETRILWKNLSLAVAKGVINHIISNMEIKGIISQGNVNTSVSGNTDSASPNNHTHTVNLSGEEQDVIFKQNNDGTGLVK